MMMAFELFSNTREVYREEWREERRKKKEKGKGINPYEAMKAYQGLK